MKKIQPGHIRDGLERAFGQAGRQHRRLHRALDRTRQHLGRKRRLDLAHELPQHLDVAHGAMARRAHQAVALDQRVEAVAVMFGEQRARQLDRAQHRRRELAPDAGEGVLDEAEVEARAVGDEDTALEQRGDRVGHGFEGRRVGHHGVGDAGDLLDQRRNRLAGCDQALPARHHLAILDAQDGDLGDAVAHRMRTGALDIDDGKPARQAHAGLRGVRAVARSVTSKDGKRPRAQ